MPARAALLVLLLALGLAGTGPGSDAEEAAAKPKKGADPVKELGRVAWIRDHDAGFAKAKQTKRPVFLLFQEVPG